MYVQLRYDAINRHYAISIVTAGSERLMFVSRGSRETARNAAGSLACRYRTGVLVVG